MLVAAGRFSLVVSVKNSSGKFASYAQRRDYRPVFSLFSIKSFVAPEKLADHSTWKYVIFGLSAVIVVGFSLLRAFNPA